MAVPILEPVARSRKLRARLAALVAGLGSALLAASGCTEKVTAPPAPPPVYAVPDSIQEVFTQQCGFDGCHGGTVPARNMQLGVDARRSYVEIINVAAETDNVYSRISPGDSLNSYIVMKLRDDPRILGNPMPLGGYPMDPALTMRIAAWAAQGAPGVPVDTTVAALGF